MMSQKGGRVERADWCSSNRKLDPKSSPSLGWPQCGRSAGCTSPPEMLRSFLNLKRMLRPSPGPPRVCAARHPFSEVSIGGRGVVFARSRGVQEGKPPCCSLSAEKNGWMHGHRRLAEANRKVLWSAVCSDEQVWNLRKVGRH